jgi:hypothetical protein
MIKRNVNRSTALARSNTEIEPWRGPNWQSLWLASQARPWRSLALVPAGPGASPALLLKVANTLAQTGMVHLNAPIHVADATSITLAQLVEFLHEVRYHTEQGAIVLLALAALSENVTSVSLAQAADVSMLVVLLHRMSVADGKKTIERVGLQHFVGSAVLRTHSDGQ